MPRARKAVPCETPEKPFGKKPKGYIRRSKQLAMEYRELREQMGMKRIPVDAWCAAAPQELRDQMAARALMAEWLNEFNALIRLGILARGSRPPATDADGEPLPLYEEIFERIFRTEGVREILRRDLTDVEQQKQALLARQAQIALHGSDESATRAFLSLARVAGWNKQEAVAPAVSVSLYQMLGDRDGGRIVSAKVNDVAIGTAEDFLGHEPGDAAPVPDDD